MCGIFGIYCNDGLEGYGADIKMANDVVNHRGPDGEGFALFRQLAGGTLQPINHNVSAGYVNPNNSVLVLAHRRLAIIDITQTGRQPMCIDDSGLWIVFNGEIYNYIELRAELCAAGCTFRSTSDTEVILNAYKLWGEACVERFNGIWAFAIVDIESGKIFCSRDRFGVKPLHYFFDGKYFIFASEIKQILCFHFVHRRVNEKIVYDYLTYGAIEQSVETFFQGIYNLCQGYNMSFNIAESCLSFNCYYKPTLAIDNVIGQREAAEEFRRLLVDSVRLQMRSDVVVGSCLSGGLDSTSILCIAVKLLNNREMKTFSSHFDEKEANEIVYQRAAIKACGVIDYFTYPNIGEFTGDMDKIVWHQEEPFSSTSIYAQWAVFKLIRANGIKVVLDGQGADEMLAGYDGFFNYYMLELFLKHRYWTLIREISNQIAKHGRPLSRLSKAFVGKINRNSGNWITDSFRDKYAEESLYVSNKKMKTFGALDVLNNSLYQYIFKNSIPQLLKYEDRNSMAFSVEARVPFLDHRLVEFTLSLPADYKISGGYSKYVLRTAMNGLIPEIIRTRTRKLGFATPERKWQLTGLRRMINEALDNESLTPFINAKKATEHFDRMENSNVLDFSPWRWVSLHLWRKRFDV